MAPNPRVVKAFRAMKDIGISEEKVKPVLKNLLRLYDKNWELIEEENYRALADAIFENEEAEEANRQKSVNAEPREALQEEAHALEETERPLKRLRLRYQDNQAASSLNNSSGVVGTSLKRPKEEEPEQPQLNRNKGKQLALPGSSSQASAIDGTHYAPRNPELDSSQRMRLRYRGMGTRSVPEKSINGLCLKEPKLEPGIELPPTQKTPSSLALIKPKDEPVTDDNDMPQIEIPISVIHPESSKRGDYSNANGLIRENDTCQPLAIRYPERSDLVKGILATENEMRANSELEQMSTESVKLEIGSSPCGEVKISLCCDSAVGRHDFRMPSLDAVLKYVEDKCLQSYKVLDPNFSVKKLMDDMCRCFLELQTESISEAEETVNVTSNVESSEKSSAADDLGAGSLPCITSNVPLNANFNSEAVLPQKPQIYPSCNGLDENILSDENLSKSMPEFNEENDANAIEETNSYNLVTTQGCQSTSDKISSRHDGVDVAKGQERILISVVNEINSEVPPSFHYIPENVVFQNACVDFSLACIADGDCCSNCCGDCLSLPTPCACAHEEFAYTREGLVKEDFLKECISMDRDPEKHCQYFCKECPLERAKNEDIVEPCKGHLVRKFIKECWWKCGCNKQCGNRVVQRGITQNLQVFMTTGGKGWGLRTLEHLPKGAFVCEYVGEVLTNAEFFDRVSRSSKGEEHFYPVLLDAAWGSERVSKDEEALCLDATGYGNVARFINHRCFDSNLVGIPVEVETPVHHYYHLAFFTTTEVKAMEELTWDYGIDFDDIDHPVKAFHCQCGSRFCRNIKRPSRSRSASRR